MHEVGLPLKVAYFIVLGCSKWYFVGAPVDEGHLTAEIISKSLGTANHEIEFCGKGDAQYFHTT